ncbi:MAG: hypothetical protein AAGB11_16605 [Pseudomonadota bacterium]
MTSRYLNAACAIALSLGLAAPAAAQTAVTQAKDFDAFSKAFCAAPRDGGHIFVLPVKYFGEGRTVDCSDGTYTLRASEPSDDPGHIVMNVDPPSGVTSAFDCDGKADIGLAMVAVNCIPVSSEAPQHKKT